MHPIPNSTDPLINDAIAASLVNAVGIDLFSQLANAAYPYGRPAQWPKADAERRPMLHSRSPFS